MKRSEEDNARKFTCPRCGAEPIAPCRAIAGGKVHMERMHVAKAAERAKTPDEAIAKMSPDLRRLMLEVEETDQLKQQMGAASLRWSRKVAGGGYQGAYVARQVEEGERLGLLRRAAGSPPTMILSDFGRVVRAQLLAAVAA